jgi:hypothetical protein
MVGRSSRIDGSRRLPDLGRALARRAGAGRARRWLSGKIGGHGAAPPVDEGRWVDKIDYQSSTPLPVDLDLSEWLAFRRVLFAEMLVPDQVAGSPVVAVAAIFGGGGTAWERDVVAGQRIAFRASMPDAQHGPEVALGFRCADGGRYVVEDPSSIVLQRTRFHGPHQTFVDQLARLPGGTVVEVGSRNRSGRTYTGIVPEHLRYVGVDILEGPNVDIVGDAHELSSLVEPGSVDAVFSIATFEHLAMPWRCAVEINKVLKPGGVCFVLSHQTFPLHETPWDFFRFSDNAWHALFNQATGFEILDIAMGEAAAVTGLAMTPITLDMDRASAFLGSSVTCRKVCDATVDWPVPLDRIARSVYPQ